MNFRTEIQIKKSLVDISYQDSIVLLGSCFAENIGRKLQTSLFRADINPFGILYNPLSIEKAIRILLENKQFSETDLFLHHGVWNSFAHHGSFSDVSKTKVLEHINQRMTQSLEALKKTDFLLITFGTAWVYELKESRKIVANCHKLPENTFTRRRLTVQEIVDYYAKLITDIQTINPKLNIIFTISPIRHWKDGAHENQLSKSVLLLSVAELQSRFAHAGYFPAYEIVMDELRDYRFYEEDMIHPNQLAISYIWERFSETYFSSETKTLQKEIMQIAKRETHRPFNPDTEEHRAFLHQTEEMKKRLKNDYPFI